VGPLKDVKNALSALIKKIQDYADSSHTQDPIKMLVLQPYVSKIIGVGKHQED
jgi:hypothetical protein